MTRKLLVVDDVEQNRLVLESLFRGLGDEVFSAANGAEALARAQKTPPDLIVSDILMPVMDGFAFCRECKKDDRLRNIPFIFYTSTYTDPKDEAFALGLGADRYLGKPIEPDELADIVHTLLDEVRHGKRRAAEPKIQEEQDVLKLYSQRLIDKLEHKLQQLEEEVEQRQLAEAALRKSLAEVERLQRRLQDENIYLQDEIKVVHNFGSIIGSSKALRRVLVQVEQVAATDTTVLILGETGTGKELVARAIQELSPRKQHPLVKVNCAALPATLIESELFGHEKGAFTGATARKVGRFELADHGTLFLDEIGDLPLELQSKLLRVLQENEFERVGGAATIKVDVRIITATNRKLEELVRLGAFREDLYFRLNTFPIVLPPLRERREDIPLLAKHFVDKFGPKVGKKIDTIPAGVMKNLQAYSWPGNVRELENVLERAMVLSKGPRLQLGSWWLSSGPQPTKAGGQTLAEAEKSHILGVLEQTGWRVSGRGGAAEILGLKPTTLESRMKKLAIKRPG